MPRQLENISDDADQRHTILFDESEIIFRLRFLPVVRAWVFDAIYKGRSVYGVKLALDVLHIRSANFPFDFTVRDLAGVGLDPFKLDDFSAGRCALYLLDADDMGVIRGAPVPL